MTAPRFASLPLFLLLLAAPGVDAAPRPRGPLTFEVTAHVNYRARGEAPAPDEVIRGRVFLSGGKARVETRIGTRDRVLLLNPPEASLLIPSQSAGVHWKATAPTPGADGTDLTGLMVHPDQISAVLMSLGAHSVASPPVSPADARLAKARVLEVENFRRQPGNTLLVWVGRDGLPLRLELKGGALQLWATWQDFSHPAFLPGALFAAPQSYHMRQVASPPPFSLF